MGKCTDDMINVDAVGINKRRLGKLNCFIKWLKDEGVIDDTPNSFKMNAYASIARVFGIDLGYEFNCIVGGVPYSVFLARDAKRVKPERCKSVPFSNEKFISFIKGKSERLLACEALIADLKVRYGEVGENNITEGLRESFNQNTIKSAFLELRAAGVL